MTDPSLMHECAQTRLQTAKLQCRPEASQAGGLYSAEGVVVVVCDGIVTQLGLRVGGRLYLTPVLQLSSFVSFAFLQGE